MDEDQSCVIKQAFNVHGKRLKVKETKRKNFCHFAIQYHCWYNSFGFFSNRIRPNINMIFIAMCIGCILINKLFNLQIHNKTWLIIVIIQVVIYFYLRNCLIFQEDLICVKDLGLQTSTEYFTGKTVEEFIPQETVADIIINEVIHCQRIIYVLVVLVGKVVENRKNKNIAYSDVKKVKTLFKGLKPRLEILMEILNETQQTMFPEDDLEK